MKVPQKTFRELEKPYGYWELVGVVRMFKRAIHSYISTQDPILADHMFDATDRIMFQLDPKNKKLPGKKVKNKCVQK